VEEAIADALDFTPEEFRAMAGEAVTGLRACANQYFSHSELIRTSHNKAKHGVTMVTDTDLTPREFYVITRAHGAPQLVKFTVDANAIRRVRRGVGMASTCSRFLAGVAWGLLASGHLYPDRRRGARVGG
jgi:hypothetical protein